MNHKIYRSGFSVIHGVFFVRYRKTYVLNNKLGNYYLWLDKTDDMEVEIMKILVSNNRPIFILKEKNINNDKIMF